jgi:hypothetical protein
MSIKLGKDWPERYIDPEPLIALWPLRVPVDGSEVGLVNTVAPIGAPLGSAPLSAARKRKLAKAERGAKAGKAHAASGDDGEKESPAPASDGEGESESSGEPASDE